MERKMFKITITKWVYGVPTIIKTIEGFETKEEGMDRLRDIGHSWDYDLSCAGHLLDENGKKVGQLNIWQHTYGVKDLERREKQ
jgi:hypothetical protein